MKPIKPYRFLLLNLLSVKLAEHTFSLSYFFGLYCLELHCLFCLQLNCLFCLFSIAEKEYGFIADVEKIACVKIKDKYLNTYDDDHRCLRTHTHSVVTHAPAKAYDYTMGVADARLMT